MEPHAARVGVKYYSWADPRLSRKLDDNEKNAGELRATPPEIMLFDLPSMNEVKSGPLSPRIMR